LELWVFATSTVWAFQNVLRVCHGYHLYVALKTYTGLKAVDTICADPPLVSSITSSVDNTLGSIII